MPKRLTKWVGLCFVFVFCLMSGFSVVYADSLQSQNFILNEPVIGVGDINQSTSANFQAVNSTGDIAIGNSSSSSYQVNAGSKTSPDPVLSFSIISSSGDFGSFSPTTSATATTSFSVSNYTSYGYVAQIFGSAPTFGGHTISAMPTQDSPQTGHEQFGINLVTNTSPVTVGANINNGQFGFGTIDANYGTPNKYRYANGDPIASAPKSSGLTIYTISYLVNVSSITPSGKYTGNQTIIVTGTY